MIDSINSDDRLFCLFRSEGDQESMPILQVEGSTFDRLLENTWRLSQECGIEKAHVFPNVVTSFLFFGQVI